MKNCLLFVAFVSQFVASEGPTKMKSSSPDWFWNVFIYLLQAKGKERQWLKNQALGELDDAKIIDGLTGEKAIYKRRGELDPEVCVCVLLQIFKAHLSFFFLCHTSRHTHSQAYTHNFDLYPSDDTFQWCVWDYYYTLCFCSSSHTVSRHFFCRHVCSRKPTHEQTHTHSTEIVLTLVIQTHTNHNMHAMFFYLI